MSNLPDKCPICGGIITMTSFACNACGSSVHGQFTLGGNPFAALSPEQVEFVKTFVRCEGKINRMEAEVGLSYPTIRNRLQEVIRALGYEPNKDEREASRALADADRKRILDDLEAGRADAEQTLRRLRGEE